MPHLGIVSDQLSNHGAVNRHNACNNCQNRKTCRAISVTLRALHSVDLKKIATRVALRRLDTVSDHLRREGFAYPFVAEARHCWLHHKYGVAMYYEAQLKDLALQITEPTGPLAATARFGPAPDQPRA